jgi:hypothetical protein
VSELPRGHEHSWTPKGDHEECECGYRKVGNKLYSPAQVGMLRALKRKALRGEPVFGVPQPAVRPVAHRKGRQRRMGR